MGNNPQLRERTGKGWRTCFISSPADTDVSIIKTLLEKRGIKPVVASELPLAGVTISEHINKAISKADLLVAVLDPEQSSENVYYQIGYASALGKRIIILAPPKLKSIPSNITGMLYVRSDSKNREVIDFALDQALALPKPTKRKPRKRDISVEQKPKEISVSCAKPALYDLRQTPGGSQPIGLLSDKLIEELDLLGDRADHKKIDGLVVSALSASGISLVAHAPQVDRGVDLAIWVDGLEPLVGNPLLIQIKGHLDDQTQVSRSLDQVSKYLLNTNAHWALVLYQSGFPPAFDLPAITTSSVLFMEIRELLTRLRSECFIDIIRDLRNQRVHGRSL